jgi:hypothetical protein
MSRKGYFRTLIAFGAAVKDFILQRRQDVIMFNLFQEKHIRSAA